MVTRVVVVKTVRLAVKVVVHVSVKNVMGRRASVTKTNVSARRRLHAVPYMTDN